MSHSVKCPGCRRIYAVKPELAGKAVRCKCGQKLTIPGCGSAPAGCPNCSEPMAANAVLCTRCGYNRKTGGTMAGARAPMPAKVANGGKRGKGLMIGAAVALVIGVGGWFAYAHFSGRFKSGVNGRVSISISRETTVITGPLRADGTLDYVAAINAKYGAGVTAENNGFVLWLEVMGTGEQELSPKSKGEMLRMIGAQATGAGAEVWEGFRDYVERTQGPYAAASAEDDLADASHTMWKAGQHPDLAAFIKSHEALLAKATQATERPRWWIPVVAEDGESLLSINLPSLGSCRDIVNVLCARAIQCSTTGDVDGFVRDIETVRRLGRQVASGPTLIERLVGLALDALATNAVATVAASGALTEAQCKTVAESLERFGPLPEMVESVDIIERWEKLDTMQWIALGKKHDPRFKMADLNQEVWDAAFKKLNGMMDDYLQAARRPGMGDFKAALATWDRHMETIRNQATQDQGPPLQGSGESREAYGSRVAEWIAATMLPSFGKAVELGRRGEQQVQMVRLVLAAAEVKAKTGKWPARAEEVVPGVLMEVPKDMYSAGGAAPLRYVLYAGGPRVYTVGENGRDDGGVRGGTQKDDIGVGAP